MVGGLEETYWGKCLEANFCFVIACSTELSKPILAHKYKNSISAIELRISGWLSKEEEYHSDAKRSVGRQN